MERLLEHKELDLILITISSWAERIMAAEGCAYQDFSHKVNKKHISYKSISYSEFRKTYIQYVLDKFEEEIRKDLSYHE